VRLPIRWKLILGVGLPLVAINASTAAISHYRLKQIATEQLRERVTQRTSLIADRLDGHFDVLAQVARSAAAFVELASAVTEEDIYALVRSNVAWNPHLYGSCIAFAPGMFKSDQELFAPYAHRSESGVESIDLAKMYDYTDGNWEWYSQTAGDRKPAWTEPYFDEGAGNILMCTYAVPFFKNGELWGIATIDVDIQALQREIDDEQFRGGRYAILSQSGRFISHRRPEFVMKESIFSVAERFDRPDLAAVGQEVLAGHRAVRRMPRLQGGEPDWVCYAPIESTGWAFAAALPESSVMTPVYGILRRRVIILAGGTLLVLLIVVLVAHHITRPIERLSGALADLGSGDLNVQVEHITSNDEIGEFARAFNIMVKALNAKVKALTKSTAAREALESELRVARNIQTSLLPQTFPPFPDRTEFELHAVNLPAQRVAGDFFDFFFVSERTLAVVMADVSGKGVPAGMMMAVTRTLIRNLSQRGLGPAEVVRNANQALVKDSASGKFVTLFLGHFDTHSGLLRYANAGHNPPYRVGSDGKVHKLPLASGIPMGIDGDADYTDDEIVLEHGDMLVLYTDGVTEARDRSGRFFGEAGLEAFLAQRGNLAVDGCCDALTKILRDFQATELQDDVTVLMLRRSAATPPM